MNLAAQRSNLERLPYNNIGGVMQVDLATYNRIEFNNIVRYIAFHYHKSNKKAITQQILYKIIALFDFEHLKKTGFPALEIEYYAMENGPVPIILYNEIKDLKSTDEYQVREGYNSNVREILAVGSPQEDYLSYNQKKIIDGWIFILSGHSAATASKASHEDIRSWKKAWERRGSEKRSKMDYKDEFEAGSIPDNYYLYLDTK